MTEPDIKASDHNDNLYVTWQLVYAIEGAEAKLFKISAERASKATVFESTMLTAVVSVSIAIAASMLYTMGPSELHIPIICATALAFMVHTWHVIHRPIPQQLHEIQEDIELYTDYIKNCTNYLHDVSMIPPTYWRTEILHQFYAYMESGRAESVLEAISVYEKEVASCLA